MFVLGGGGGGPLPSAKTTPKLPTVPFIDPETAFDVPGINVSNMLRFFFLNLKVTDDVTGQIIGLAVIAGFTRKSNRNSLKQA